MRISNQPTWVGIRKKKFPALKKQVNTDVVIVGGGMAGVLTAYTLAKAGKKVVILEADELGSGITTYTTGFLTNVIDTDLSDLIKMYGLRDSKLIWDSHYQAINYIEQIASNENIECEFVRCTNYVFSSDKKDFSILEKEYAAARKIGFNTKLINSAQLPFENAGSWAVRKQAKFHAPKFLYGLINALQELGVEIYEKSEVSKVNNRGNISVLTKTGGEVIADDVTIATYQPFNNPKEVWFKKGKYRSYIFEVQIPKGVFTEGIYEDTKNPYNYFRVDTGFKHDRLILGGQDHRVEIKMHPNRNYKALEQVLKTIMGEHKYTITRKWDGTVLEPSDGLALIGKINDHEYVSTAFSGNGLTYSAIAAMLISDLINRKNNPWAKIYDPTRIPTLYQLAKKGKDYTGELVKGAMKNFMKSKAPIRASNK